MSELQNSDAEQICPRRRPSVSGHLIEVFEHGHIIDKPWFRCLEKPYCNLRRLGVGDNQHMMMCNMFESGMQICEKILNIKINEHVDVSIRYMQQISNEGPEH